MDTYLGPDPEFSQGWGFDLFDQSYLETSEMFRLPDISILSEQLHTSFNNSMAMEATPFLDFNFSEMDTPNVFESELVSRLETKGANEIDLSSSSGSRSPIKSGSPISTVQNSVKSASTGHRTRKMDEGLVEFEVSLRNSLGRNHRRALPPEKRKKVRRVREVGACVRCRFLKRPCTVELPCDGCLRSCGSIPLGSALCVRRKLLDVRGATDVWERQRDLSWIRDEIPLLTSSKRTIKLSFWDQHDTNIFLGLSNNTWDGGHDGPYVLPVWFEIEVQDFVPHPGRQSCHNLGVFKDYDYTIPAENFYYAIPEGSLPTLESLESFALELTRFRRRAIFGDSLQGAFMSLGRRYYECERTLPLSDLMRKTVRLSCLHGLWCSALPRLSLQQPPVYASKAVHMQIAVIISQGIEFLEHDILRQLQDTIFDTKGPGKSNMLPTWMCLFLLMLTYRRTILVQHSETEKNDKLDLAQNCCQHMYEMLISIYSGLFRPSSPLWLNFLKDEVFQLFGRDFKIVERLGTVKTEIGCIFNSATKEHDFQSSRDALLRTLVLENEKRLGQKAGAKPTPRPSSVCAKLS